MRNGYATLRKSVMDKKRLHHIWTKFRGIRPWYFLVIALISVGLSIYALRQNNLTMVKLRSAVYAADKNNGDVAGALKNLQAYVTAHMNTNLANGPNGVYPPIQLQYTYQRLEQAAIAQTSNTNQDLYTQAQTYCQQQIPDGFSGRYRITCIEQYIESHGASAATIPTSLYEFDFVSPTWSPDLAGWSILASAFFLLIFIVSWITDRWLRHVVD